MNTERNNNNNNNNISSGDQRPNFVDVASGRRPSPKLFYIDQQLRGSENPLDFELTLEEEIEKDLMEDVDMGDADNATSPVEENAKPQKEVLDVTVNIQSNISVLNKKIMQLNEKLCDAINDADIKSTSMKLQILTQQRNDLLKQYNMLQSGGGAKPTAHADHQQGISTNLMKKSIPVGVIPHFRITSIDATLVHNNKNGDPKKNDNGTSYPSLEAFFNTFESVFTHFMTDESIEHNWFSALRMSFTACPDLVFSWYKKNIEKKKEELTWTQVKRLITERFDIQTTNFQKGLRLLRISPTFDEDFVDYVDRFTNLFDELTEVNDNKLVVMLFFNSLPKQFRKVIYDKINMITGNKSDETDPFPATWRETAVLFNQHKVMLSNELKKVYVSFGNKDSYAQGLKRDKKAKPTSDNDVASSDNKKYNSLSRHDAIKHHDRKRKHAADDHNPRMQKTFRHSPNGSNASRWAPHNRLSTTNICHYCNKEPFSLAHRNNCAAYIKLQNSNFKTHTNDNRGNNHRNYTPSYDKQNSEFKRVNMVVKQDKITIYRNTTLT